MDEKYPCTILTIQMCYPYKTILLLERGCYRKGAEKWIKSHVGNNLVHVFTMAGFQDPGS